MVLSTSWTKTLLVTGRCLKTKISNKALKITCNGGEIKQVTWVTIGNNLNLTDRIDELCMKVAQRIVLVKKDKA